MLKLSDVAIPIADQVKYLGVILDSKMNLNSHVEYTKGRAQKRISILKSVAGKSYGADRSILLRIYKSMILPILEYSSLILDGPGNNRVESLEVIQNSCLRIASGALRTSPIRALQVETNVMPLSLRQRELLLRYFLKVSGDSQHPCRHLMNFEACEELYRDLSERYLKRISGFPVPYRLTTIFQEAGYIPPAQVFAEGEPTAPWTLHDVTALILPIQDKRLMTEREIQAEFHNLIHSYPGYRLLFTDGSKQGVSVACAFTVNNAFFSHKLQDGISIYTAELVAIREAMKFVRDNHVPKAIICSDSLSAIRALSAKNRNHPVLIEILETHHEHVQNGNECIMLWIPGHQGLAGNVRADYWARKAHDKPEVTPVRVGYREYVPSVRKCVSDLFSDLWRDYRLTHLKQLKPATGYWDTSVRQSRKEEVILCRLRLGHTLLTHSHVIDQVPPVICDVCHCRLDVRHLLLDCRKFVAARRDLNLVCRGVGKVLNLENVLGNSDSVILDALFEYLRRCDLLDQL